MDIIFAYDIYKFIFHFSIEWRKIDGQWGKIMPEILIVAEAKKSICGAHENGK
jgi:hypothetical protein